MSKALETVMESREEFMVSPVGDSKPTLRTAHFLKPSLTSYGRPRSDILSSSMSLPRTFEPKKWPLTVKFTGWQCPPRKWIHWVDSLYSTFESVWKKVGIKEAIMGSKYHVLKDEDLAFGIAERWCSKTNTLVFPWGEATITLEDMIFLGGYPVLGDSFFRPLEAKELKEVEGKLISARKEIFKSNRNKACPYKWMNTFMNSGREVEHEAFLAAWLSMFVFPGRSLLIKSFVFPIAVHLARGNAVALAPAVLASIYKDLSLLKQAILDLTKCLVGGDEKCFELVLQSPFYLVQIWVWERIHVLQPKPKLINAGDTVMSRWHRVKALKIDVRSVLDSAMEEFIWRPYARFGGKSKNFFPENSLCILLDHTLEEEIESFIICMRVSELVGLDCIEHYLPHRVAMQFGMDQDIPGFVARSSETPEIAWSNYIRPMRDKNIYIPSRFFEADVTTRYVEWWKKSVLDHQDTFRNLVQGKRSSRSTKKMDADADVPPGFSPKCCRGGLLRNNGYRSFRNDETDQNVVLLSPVVANKTDDLMEMKVEMLAKIENINVVRGPKKAKTDAKGDDGISCFSSSTDNEIMRKMDLEMKSLPILESETSMRGQEEEEEAKKDANGIQESREFVTLWWTKSLVPLFCSLPLLVEFSDSHGQSSSFMTTLRWLFGKEKKQGDKVGKSYSLIFLSSFIFDFIDFPFHCLTSLAEFPSSSTSYIFHSFIFEHGIFHSIHFGIITIVLNFPDLKIIKFPSKNQIKLTCFPFNFTPTDHNFNWL
ncbi:uncharacterized protein LOC129302255 [Prosopis cineraria]|uniref:uncharacterized protein LOC129302255 n=1 Tax=Prosopis cineraria TaxID=364024 RepID=UPI00240FDEB4|nr:uncharacterized protein LOC129302255 [Prosopis cineraria]